MVEPRHGSAKRPRTCARSPTSVAHSEQAFGLLALASEDPQRFYPDMGTLYLKRLGEIVSAALARHLTVKRDAA